VIVPRGRPSLSFSVQVPGTNLAGVTTTSTDVLHQCWMNFCVEQGAVKRSPDGDSDALMACKHPCPVPCPRVIGGLGFSRVHLPPHAPYMPLIRRGLPRRISSLNSATTQVAFFLVAAAQRGCARAGPLLRLRHVPFGYSFEPWSVAALP
jgi:hypothetical protein